MATIRASSIGALALVLTLLALLVPTPAGSINCQTCSGGQCEWVIGGGGYYSCQIVPGVGCVASTPGCNSSAPCEPQYQQCPELDYEHG
jgi:hypothetical protein